MNTPSISSTNTFPKRLNQDYLNCLINDHINGKICWQAHLDYGQELCLEIGTKTSCDSPALQDEYKGEWQLGTRASFWAIFINDKNKLDLFIRSSEDTAIIKKKIEQLNNQTMEGIKINKSNPDFHYRFNFGHYVLLIPEQNNYDDLPLWELFMADRRVLEVFPHLEFQLHSQDEIA